MSTKSLVDPTELNKEIKGTTKSMVDFRRELNGELYRMETKQDTSLLSKLSDKLELLALVMTPLTSRSKHPGIVVGGEVASFVATYTNVEKFVSAIERISAFKTGMEGIHDQLLKITDPKAWDLKQVGNEFKDLLEQANEMGSDQDVADINRLIGLQRSRIERQYDGFDDKLQSIKDENDRIDRDNAAKVMDPQQWDLAELEEWYQEIRALAIKHGEGVSDVEALYGKRRTQIIEKYAAEALAKAEQAAAEQAAQVKAVMDRVMESARATISARLEALAEERRVIEENADRYRGILASIKSVQARFVSDPRISPTSNEKRLADSMAQLNAAYAKAQNGDEDAAAEIADLAMAAAEANVAYNASSEEAARVQSQIATILSNTSTLASRELQVAQFNLDANEAQVDLLEQLLGKTGQPGQPDQAASATMADVNALMTAFAQANKTYNFSGMTTDQVSNNPIWRSFEDELFSTISRLEKSDAAIDWLRESLAWAPNELGTNFEFAARRRVPKLMDRLLDFGVTPTRPPGFAAGGRTGSLAIVHPNEMIYTGPPAMVYNARETASMMTGGNVLRELQGIRADIGVLSRTVSISGEDQVAQLSRHDMRLAAIESNFSLARARS